MWITPLLAAAALWMPAHPGRVCRAVSVDAQVCVRVTLRNLNGATVGRGSLFGRPSI